jgi:hypothetical protein
VVPVDGGDDVAVRLLHGGNVDHSRLSRSNRTEHDGGGDWIVLYFVLIEYTAVQAAPSFARWLLFTDATSWVGYHTTVGAPAGHTIVTGGLLVAGGTAALWAFATKTFERRDVT